MIKRVKKIILILLNEPQKVFFLFFKKNPQTARKKLYYLINHWICITVFKLTTRDKYSRIQSSIPWVVILSTDKTFLKISWRKESINHEVKNMQSLSEHGPLHYLIVPYLHKKRLWYSVIESQRKYPITSEYELFYAAEKILKRFKLCAECGPSNKIDDFNQVINGLNVIEELYGWNQRKIYEDQISIFMDKESFYIGPAHGDFHPKNILKDSIGNYYIIDLDCFRRRGIQELDAIYFISEYYANINKINWYEQLILFVEKKQEYSIIESSFIDKYCKINSLQWLLIYFFDRMGQDRLYVDHVSEMPASVIVKFLDIYIRNVRLGNSLKGQFEMEVDK